MSMLKNIRGGIKKSVISNNVTDVISTTIEASPSVAAPISDTNQVIDSPKISIKNNNGINGVEKRRSKAAQQPSIKINAVVPEVCQGNETIAKMYGNLGGTIRLANYEGAACSTFGEMGLRPEILKAIYDQNVMKWEFPSPIQSIGIKPVIDKRDLICQAQAGTGKTGTYMIAALQLIDQTIRNCQVIVLSPTRELTEQTFKVTQKLASFTDITVASHIGGYIAPANWRNVEYSHNLKETDVYTPPYSEQIVVATPGRLKMLLMTKKVINPANIKLIILDEADKMLQQGFMADVISVFSVIPSNTALQVELYSAGTH